MYLLSNEIARCTVTFGTTIEQSTTADTTAIEIRGTAGNAAVTCEFEGMVA